MRNQANESVSAGGSGFVPVAASGEQAGKPSESRKFRPWRVLKIGTRVRLLKYRAGAEGAIREVLTPDRINGLKMYGVLLDSTGTTADMLRYELEVI